MKENEEKDEMTLATTFEKLGRRGFLRKLSMAAVGLATALVGLPQKAEALVHVGCCWLCKGSQSCSGACCWTWGCCDADPQSRFWRCTECYSAGAACNGSCTGVVCSNATRTGFLC